MRPPLRGALIGYGYISENGHLPAYLQCPASDVEIVAVADVCEGRRAIANETLPSARVYSDYRALLDAENHALDFVDVSAPPCYHAEIATASLERGLHVLCEKPLAPTVTEAREMLETAKKMKRVLFPCHNYKHAPVVKTIRRIIDSGAIGKIHTVNLSTYRNTHAKGVTEWRTDWRRDLKTSGGGIAMDHGSHSFYLLFDWLGTLPTAITAKMHNRAAPRFDTEDSFHATLAFPNGQASAFLTWTAGVRKVIYALQGERGAITVDDDELQLAVMRSTDGPDVGKGAVAWDVERKSIRSDWMDSSHVGWFNSLFDEFKSAIDRGDWVGREAREAYFCVELITAAYRSAREGSREIPIGTRWT